MKKLFTYSLAAAMALGSFMAVNSAWAEGDGAGAVVTDKEQANWDKTKVSQKGFAAMQTMHAARLAIFNGETDTAKEMLSRAEGLMKEMEADHHNYQANEGQVPINGSITLAESFVPDKSHADYLNKANQYFQKGQKAEGIQQLREGKIAVDFARVLMPYEATSKKLNEAIELANQEKYYQTNLALKAAEEGMGFDSISLFDTEKDSK